MPPELRRVARRQGGCFTKRQARQLGMSDAEIQRRLDSGDWRIVMGDVIVVTAAPVTDEMMAWTAVLTIGRPVALAGKFAGAWLKLDACPSWQRPALVIPHSRGKLTRPGVDIYRARGTWQVIECHGLPVTPIPVVIRDLAVDCPTGTLRDVVQHALRRRRTSFDALAATLGRGIPGAAALRSVLEEVGPGYQSVWERRLHLALRRAGVDMQPQVKVDAEDGRCAFLDLGIRRLKYGVEVDGFLSHMARFAGDRRRARMLAKELEWTVDAFAVSEIADDMAAVVREIATTVTRLEAKQRRTG
jgi:very-short-patch-repair endonuclease